MGDGGQGGEGLADVVLGEELELGREEILAERKMGAGLSLVVGEELGGVGVGEGLQELVEVGVGGEELVCDGLEAFGAAGL